MEEKRQLPVVHHIRKMTKEGLFEKQGRKNSCRICGQYIKNGEEYGLLIVNGSAIQKELRNGTDPKHKNLSNVFIHMSEFHKLMEKHEGDIEKVVLDIHSKNRPATKNATVPDEAVMEKFHEYARKKGWWLKSETKNNIRFKSAYRSREAGYVFDKRFLTIESAGRRPKMFEGLFLQEMNARLHEYLFDLEEGYRAIDTLLEATEKVNEMMGR